MVGPTLMAFGTPEQQTPVPARPSARGEHLWCQLFSEPDAGSDLASLRTRAVRDGDEWVVTGQKVWTSGAAPPTGPSCSPAPSPTTKRHQGITYFLCDMRSPGVEVRPIVQINRAAHFNEVHLDEVRIPADCVVGEVGEGWTVARVTLGAERAMIGSMNVGRAHRRRSSTPPGRPVAADDPMLRQDLVDVHIRGTVLRYLGDRVLDRGAHRRPGRARGQHHQARAVDVHGPPRRRRHAGARRRRPARGRRPAGSTGDATYGRLQDMFLGQWSSRIGGGTEQIQRNLIGERALGLPRDPRPSMTSHRSAALPVPPSVGWFAVGRLDELATERGVHRAPAGQGPRGVARRRGRRGRQWRRRGPRLARVRRRTAPTSAPTSASAGGSTTGASCARSTSGRSTPTARNAAIPYAERPNRKARVRSYPTAVRNGLRAVLAPPRPRRRPRMGRAPGAHRRARRGRALHVDGAHGVAGGRRELGRHGPLPLGARARAGGPIGEITLDGPVRRVQSTQLFNSSRGTFEGALESTSYGPGVGVIHFDLMGRVTMVSATTPVDEDAVEVRFTLYHSGDEIAGQDRGRVRRRGGAPVPRGHPHLGEQALPALAGAGADRAAGHRVPPLGGAVLPRDRGAGAG